MRSIFLFLSFLLTTSILAGQSKDTVTVIGVGDIMMGSNYPNSSTLPPDGGNRLFEETAAVLSDADVTMGNLEGVLLDKGGWPKTCHNPKVCYVFRSPEKYVDHLSRAGFDVMSLANNHSSDFGEAGRKSSAIALQKAGIYYAGHINQPYVIFEKNGAKFGFIAFAPNTGCVNINDLTEAVRLVKFLNAVVDIVIVSFHGGAEGPAYQHVPHKNEIFYGENRGNVFLFAHTVIDAGADIVFGHGPHVTRAVEVYNNRFIAYSLGNFCTFGGINVSGVCGLSPIVKVYTDRQGSFYKARITSTYQTFYSPVKMDGENRALQAIKELTSADFPETTVKIDDSGWVWKSQK